MINVSIVDTIRESSIGGSLVVLWRLDIVVVDALNVSSQAAYGSCLSAASL